MSEIWLKALLKKKIEIAIVQILIPEFEKWVNVNVVTAY